MEGLLEFQWDGLIGDLKGKAPTLFQVLSAIMVRNDCCRKKTEKAHYSALCTATAILINEMCGLQYLVSLMLFFHMQRKVSSNFNVCMFQLIVFIIGLWSIQSPQCECKLLSYTKVCGESEQTVQSTRAEVD